jgi:signal transduction histidine kinase
LRKGAYYYLAKPLDVDLVQSVVARALEKVRLQKDLQRSLEEIRAREEQLLKAHNELEQRVEERTAALAQANVALLEQMAERQRMEEELLKARKIESVGVLAAGIAHDFNNLLTGILGYVSLAKVVARPNANVIAYLTEAEQACQRATALTQQLLTFAKGGAPVRHTVSMVELLKESVGFALRGANVRSDLQIAANLWPVDVDAGQINQVIHNIVLNAVQAMPGGGTIQVWADNVVLEAGVPFPLPEGRHVKITVQDYGCGIPKEVLSNIFDPYFTTKAEGSGLGLTTAYAIATKHDGYITVASEVGVGTTVVIYLPASQQAMASAQTHPHTPLSGSGRILVMDDEEMIRDLLRQLLERLGYTVECVQDGAEAVAVYQRAQTAGQPFAAVILDYTIPGGMGGLETLTRLRAIDPQVTALISSGYANNPVMADWTY